jgi:hypothetical protein
MNGSSSIRRWQVLTFAQSILFCIPLSHTYHYYPVSSSSINYQLVIICTTYNRHLNPLLNLVLVTMSYVSVACIEYSRTSDSILKRSLSNCLNSEQCSFISFKRPEKVYYSLFCRNKPKYKVLTSGSLASSLRRVTI